MVLKHLYIFIMDLSTNQNNCMVHPLNYNMLQLHSQYAHTLHILKTFVVAREQFIFNTASYIIHSDGHDVGSDIAARVHSSFSSYEKELSEFHRCHHYPRWFEPWWLMTVRSSSTAQPQLGRARSCSVLGPLPATIIGQLWVDGWQVGHISPDIWMGARVVVARVG